MPRVKASPKKCIKTSNLQQSNNTWLFLMKGENLESADGSIPEIVKLRHPSTDQAAMFVFSLGDATVQEVLTFDENKRSWFIDDAVKSDGKMHLSTPIDPLFLVLPYLRKCQQAMPIEQSLRDEDYPETQRLARCENLKLSLVADRKGTDAVQAYKYNEEKALAWLQKKVERVAEVLRQKSIHVSGGAISATYVKSSKHDGGSNTEYLKYAHGIVSEYLNEEMANKLSQHLCLPIESENKMKRKLLNTNESQEDKRPKKEMSDTENSAKTRALDLTKPEKSEKLQKPVTLSKKDQARQKAAAGSKSITSFFKKK